MQPYFFPYIGYWQLINAVNKYIIYDDVNFIKGGWIQRNNILMNGQSMRIILRLCNASQNKLINEIEVLNDIYNKKILKTIKICYGRAPHFLDCFPILEEVINQDEKNLAKYLEFSIRLICKYLSINIEVFVSSEIKKNNDLRGKDKIIDICKIMGAKEYINAIGGKAFYTHDEFNARGIQLKFLKTNDIRYKQFNNEFIPNLSIIDVMMFNSINETKTLLEEFTLI